MRVTLLALCTMASCLAWSPVAVAQPAGASDEEARALFEAGRVAFEDGRFQNALEHFERAYDLSQRPGLLYNIGSSADRLRQDERALEAFEAFLAAVPNTENRPHVEARIAVLRSAITGVASDGVEPSEEPSAVASDGGPGVAPWIVLGTAAALVVVGVALLALTASDIAVVEGVEDGGAWVDIREAYDRAQVVGPIGWVFAGVGLAGVAVGLGWALSGESDSQVEARFGPRGVELRGRF